MALAETAGNSGERSLTLQVPTFPLFPFPFDPWPWPSPTIPIPAERSQTGGESPLSGNILEVLEAVYPRPDVRSVVGANARILAELLGDDDEASKEFRDLVQEIMPPSGEREPVTLGIAAFFVCCAIAGGVVGYLSRP